MNTSASQILELKNRLRILRDNSQVNILNIGTASTYKWFHASKQDGFQAKSGKKRPRMNRRVTLGKLEDLLNARDKKKLSYP